MWEKHVAFISNVAELTGYAASITMNLVLLMKTIKDIHILEHDTLHSSVVRPFLSPLGTVPTRHYYNS